LYRDKLREQHQLSEEIGAAITSVPLGEQPDEDELQDELEGLEQEAMDERMLNTGPVPVNSQLDRLPEAGKSERKSRPFTDFDIIEDRANSRSVAGKTPAKPMAEEDDEEAELAKLRAEMAM